MKRTDTKSHCPINFSLEIFGDPWSLLILRDIVCYGKHTYGEFLASKERISSRMLAMRLERLVNLGVLAKQAHESDKRKEVYVITDKGRAAIPILIELATWGAQFDPRTASPASWMEAVRADKANLRQSNRAALFCKR